MKVKFKYGLDLPTFLDKTPLQHDNKKAGMKYYPAGTIVEDVNECYRDKFEKFPLAIQILDESAEESTDESQNVSRETNDETTESSNETMND